MISTNQAEELVREAFRHHFSAHPIPDDVVKRMGWGYGPDYEAGGSNWVFELLLYEEDAPNDSLPQVAISVRVDRETEAVTLIDHGILDAQSGGNTARSDEREPFEFDVILTEVGDRKIQVMKAVREVTSLGLKEAKEAVENAPLKIKTAVLKEDATSAQEKLEAAGARVEIKPVSYIAAIGEYSIQEFVAHMRRVAPTRFPLGADGELQPSKITEEALQALEQHLPAPLPPSYRELLTTCHFLGLDLPEAVFIGPARGNVSFLEDLTEMNVEWEVSEIFRHHRVIYFGSWIRYGTYFLCFDTRQVDEAGEYPVVAIDHERIDQIEGPINSTFLKFLQRHTRGYAKKKKEWWEAVVAIDGPVTTATGKRYWRLMCEGIDISTL